MKNNKTSKNNPKKPTRGIPKSKKDRLAVAKSHIPNSELRNSKSDAPQSAIRNPQFAALRKKAEEKLAKQTERLHKLSVRDIEHLIHELGTHQIELEMQNEELRRAQEDLEASRSRYSDVYDFAPVGYFTFNEKGLILEANLTAARELGVERGRIIKQPFRVFVLTKDRTIFDDHLREVFKNENRQTCEVRLKRKSGDEFYARLESIMVQDLKGNNVCRTSLIDITENKKAETLLKEERDFISAVLSTEDALVVVLDLQGRIVSFNKTCELVTGYSFDELKGLPLWDILLVPEDVKAVRTVFNELKTGHYPNKHENYWVTKDRRHRFISWSNTSLLDSNGNVQYVIGTGIDITERKRAEDEIKRLASFPQLNPKPILEVDSSGVIVFCNAAAVETLRKLNLRDTTIFLPNDMTNILEALKQENEAQFYCEVKIGDRIFGENIYSIPQFNSIRIYVSDITERKQVEESLRHSEEYFRLLMENALDAVTILEGDGTIRYESLSVERILGYKPEELVGTRAFDLIHPDDLSDVTTIFSYGARNPGIVLSAQFRYKHKDGSWRFLDVMGKNLLDNSAIQGIVVNSRDITESMQVAEALRSERQRLINILDSMLDGVYIVNQQNEIEYVNPLIEKEYGPVNGRKCHEYFEGREKVCTWCKNQEVFKGKTVRSEWYSEKTNKTYDLINTPLKNPDGSVSKLGIFRDITERKQAEESLKKVNRTLRALSNSNQAMLHAESEAEFLKEVCGIIVEDCGHAMVWIGFAEDNEDKTVRPVASAGFEEGYIETLNITWADTERGRGPTGTAIRTGRPSICRNMLTDPAFEPWRDEALKRGYASSIVLPLMRDSKAFGVINIYSKEPDPFTEDEVKLLSELSGDLSYGILAMRSRVAHAEAEEAVSQSQARVAMFAAATFEGIVYSREGRIVDCNEQFARLMGYTVDELLGREIADLMAPEDRDRVMANIRQGRQSEIEHAMVRKDGSHVIVEAHGRPGADGPRGSRMTVLRDISECKKAERALRESEERYREVVQNTTAVIFRLDPQGIIRFANERALEFFGYSKDELIGKHAVGTIVPERETTGRDLAAMVDEIAENPDRFHSNTNENIRKNGERVWIEWTNSGVFDKDGRLMEFLSVGIDATSRKKAEERLKEAKDLSDGLNRISETISLALDLDEIMRRVVEESRMVIGCDTAAISLLKDNRWKVSYVSGFPQEIVGTEILIEEQPHATLALKTKEPVVINDAFNDERVNREHMRKYGVRSVLVVPLFSGDNPLGVIFLNHNSLQVRFTVAQVDCAAKLGVSVSLALERSRLLNALKLRAAELEALNSELEAFSYTISHDLKTPLRSIQGFAQAITEDYEDRLDEAGRDSLHRINSAGERMTQLIDAMLDISRLTSRDLINKSVDMSSIAEVIAYDLQKNEPDRIVHVIIAKEVRVQGDGDLLEIALRNLFDNAWKFTAKHTSAKIEFGKIECATPSLPSPLEGEGEGGGESELRNQRSEMEGKTVYFVRDDGAGFNMEYADKLFMPFNRLHSASEFPGLGIGLATVKKIISKHGGKIWAEGEPGKGATFYFTLGNQPPPTPSLNKEGSLRKL